MLACVLTPSSHATERKPESRLAGLPLSITRGRLCMTPTCNQPRRSLIIAQALRASSPGT